MRNDAPRDRLACGRIIVSEHPRCAPEFRKEHWVTQANTPPLPPSHPRRRFLPEHIQGTFSLVRRDERAWNILPPRNARTLPLVKIQEDSIGELIWNCRIKLKFRSAAAPEEPRESPYVCEREVAAGFKQAEESLGIVAFPSTFVHRQDIRILITLFSFCFFSRSMAALTSRCVRYVA